MTNQINCLSNNNKFAYNIWFVINIYEHFYITCSKYLCIYSRDLLKKELRLKNNIIYNNYLQFSYSCNSVFRINW